ncbi:crotonase/enoyl-CoA hydratase family protein [Dietzia sp. MNB45]|uniref:crotonase/enoyl-CoA hydratase family protein n=1 Tax=Dietzia sp. MNB45 TaxID=3238800 RepID=UPI003F808399
MSGPQVSATVVDRVHVEETDGVLVVTIDRQHARNSINRATSEAIAAAMAELDRRDDLTAGVIAGAGSVFCAGMDLKAFIAGEDVSLPELGFAGLVEKPPAKPLIAAVDGPALGGGFEIVLSCDLVVASENASFGLPEVRRGLLAGAGGLLRLPRRIPYQLAMEAALTGQPIDAETARGAGLVNRLVPAGEATAAAVELAKAIAANAPLAVRASKEIMARSREWNSEEEFDKMRDIYLPVRSSNDAREGALAFKEKRAPRWTAT